MIGSVNPYLSHQIVFIKGIPTFGTELGRICGINRLPAALVAFIFLGSCGLGRAAISAELARIGLAAGAYPLGGSNGSGSCALLGGTAVSAEFARILCAAAASPGLGLLASAGGTERACV